MDIRTFPLPRLPVPAHQNVLRVLTIHELFGYSLLSKKCKQLVKSLKIIAITINAIIAFEIRIVVRFSSHRLQFKFYKHRTPNWIRENPRPQEVRLKSSEKTTIENREYHLRDWIEHILAVFNSAKIDSLSFNFGAFKFDIKFLKESFRKADSCSFKHGGRNAFNEAVFKEFAPTKVTFYNDYFLDFRVPSKILIKNFDRMSIFNTDRFQVHLRHLLLMNTKVISIRNVHITRRALNKFIKLWQRGSSPQLEYIRVFRQNVNRRLLKMVMRRVNYQFAPDEEVRRFKSVGLRDVHTVHGGLDFFRFDGTKATVKVWCNNNAFTFLIIMAIRTFPLPRLPVPAQQNVLRILSFHELFGYSLLSKKCKMLIKSLKMVTTTAFVRIRTYISVLVTVRGSLQTLKFRFWPESHSVTLSLDFQPFEEFTKNDYNAKDYLQHVLSIFKFSKTGIIHCFEEGSHYLDMDFLKETLGQTINASLVKHSGNFEFNKTIFREFVFRKVTLWTSCFEDNIIPPWILIQNFDRISVHRKALSFRIHSDDLTLMNSRIIQLRFFLITDIQLNRFIKMWQRGSNPHLEYISVRRQNVDQRDSRIVMNAIKYQKIPREHIRRFQSVGCKDVHEFHGGLDFFRFDGTKATVKIRYNNDTFSFKIYVWWDHCIVN